MDGISIGSGGAGVTISAVKASNCAVAGETGYKAVCSGEVCAMTIGAVISTRQGVIISMLPLTNGLFMVTITAISVLIPLSVQVLSVTSFAVVRILSVFLAVGAGPSAVMAICTRCN